MEIGGSQSSTVTTITTSPDKFIYGYFFCFVVFVVVICLFEYISAYCCILHLERREVGTKHREEVRISRT